MRGFSIWFESNNSDSLEDRIFTAIGNKNVSQSEFDKMLGQWIRGSNPTLSGVALTRKDFGSDGSTQFLSGQLTKSLAHVSATRRSEQGSSGVGLIVQPLTYQYLRTENVKSFDSIGIDNGMFTKAGQANFSWDKYEKMIKVALAQEKREVLDRLNFFTVPDEPFNWKKTLEKYQQHKADVQRLRGWGAPVAICIQNGATVDNVPFNEIDVIFIGGDNAYKEGSDAKAIVDHARKLGKGVHMGRVNNLKRLNTASQWGVDTADGTYIMHELAKSLHDIEKKNPKRPTESGVQYFQRLKRILYGENQPGDLDHNGKHITEPEIINNFIDFVLDTQANSNILRRYNQIADIVEKMHGKPLSRHALWEMDRFLPAVPGINREQEVVQFDHNGNVIIGRDGKPLKNWEIFNRLNSKLPWRPMPEGIPFDPKDHRVYGDYMNRFILRMRGAGVMPQ